MHCFKASFMTLPHQHPERLAIFDLLWKYYEKTGNYSSATRILGKMAERHSTELTLAARVAYLGRAVLCVKSCSVVDRGMGELLQHLEEKMEVARVQVGLLETVRAKGGVSRRPGWRRSWWTSSPSTKTGRSLSNSGSLSWPFLQRRLHKFIARWL